jgi:hypothetical protein
MDHGFQSPHELNFPIPLSKVFECLSLLLEYREDIIGRLAINQLGAERVFNDVFAGLFLVLDKGRTKD